jgi:hypothetical protein
MSNFIEINSTYRNRNLWPIPGQFEIPFGTNYNDNTVNSTDSVSLAEPIIKWTQGYLSTGYENIFAKIGSETAIDYTMSPNVIALRMEPSGLTQIYPQQTTDYLVGLILWDRNNNYKSRINSSLYIGLNTSGEPMLLVKIDDEIEYNINDNVWITDYSALPLVEVSIIPQLFIPNGNSDDDSYLNYYIYDEHHNTYGNITGYIGKYHLLSVNSNYVFYEFNNNYSIRKTLPILPLPDTSINPKNYVPLNISTYEKIYITYDSPFSKIENFYKNHFLRIRPKYPTYQYFNGIKGGSYQNITSHTRRIIIYIYDGTNSIFTLEKPFDNTLILVNYTIEILPFSYDNFNPLTYTGTLVQQASCYEFELVNLILPNQTLSVGNGSKIAFYPFVYVEISNVSSSSSHLLHTIYSNNPNATKMVFRVPIYDVQDPATTPFVRLVVTNMMQTIKFKPDDNLLFSVRLSNGDIYNTVIPESYSPSLPNQKIQISAIFRFKRVI